MGINNWLTDSIIDLFAKNYGINKGPYHEDKLSIRSAKITNGKLEYTRDTYINAILLDVKNMKKMSDNNTRDMVTKMICKLDIVLCKELFNETPPGRTIYTQTGDYNYEKQYFSCARMEKNWIDYKGAKCGMRRNKYNDIKAYDEWSMKFFDHMTPIHPNHVGLYPSHIMNHAINMLYTNAYEDIILSGV